MSWLCPLCHTVLVSGENSYRCAQGHQFDVAKEGYVNLLPVQHKRSKEPGDSSEMMQSRRAFLDAGHYQPLRDAVCSLLVELKPFSLLDIGCGEGYYTSEFAAAVAKLGGEVWGLDISKIAIRYAAKRYRNIHFCVASSHRLPFVDSSMDAIVRIFAPCKPEELARVVKNTGVVVTVTPGPRHLVQLKGLIYPDIALHSEAVETMPDFRLQQEFQSRGSMTLSGEDAVALLQMTPFAWRAGADVWVRLREHATFLCETDFTIRVWQRV